tara:strand:- start:180 stop:383 length:204 start_codon:yes stop_codon:yes gene_type:complete
MKINTTQFYIGLIVGLSIGAMPMAVASYSNNTKVSNLDVQDLEKIIMSSVSNCKIKKQGNNMIIRCR